MFQISLKAQHASSSGDQEAHWHPAPNAQCCHTFVLHSRYRQIFCSLPEDFPCFCIPKIHPVSGWEAIKENKLPMSPNAEAPGILGAALIQATAPEFQWCPLVCRRPRKKVVEQINATNSWPECMQWELWRHRFSFHSDWSLLNSVINFCHFQRIEAMSLWCREAQTLLTITDNSTQTNAPLQHLKNARKEVLPKKH